MKSSRSKSQRKREEEKKPYQIDYTKRQRHDYEVSELSDSEIPIEYDNFMMPKEVIFAELGEGSYFGELGIVEKNGPMGHLVDVRKGLCFTSIWAT